MARRQWRCADLGRHAARRDAVDHRRYPWAFPVGLGFLLATAGTAWAYFEAISTTHTYALAKADPLLPPIALQATGQPTGAVQLAWSIGTEPTGTHFEVVRDPTGTATVVCANLTAGPCTDSGLSAATTYTYEVFAYLGTYWRSPAVTVSYTAPGTSGGATGSTATGAEGTTAVTATGATDAAATAVTSPGTPGANLTAGPTATSPGGSGSASTGSASTGATGTTTTTTTTTDPPS
ncbi:MAG: hypothetical protein ACRDWE_03770 [Acidimicrobiales bacterium]